MKWVEIDPVEQAVSVREGDLEACIEQDVSHPSAIVDLYDDLGMIHSPVSPLMWDAHFFWIRRAGEFFAGRALVVGTRLDGTACEVPHGTWQGVQREVEFLGPRDRALPLLRNRVADYLSQKGPMPGANVIRLFPRSV